MQRLSYEQIHDLLCKENLREFLIDEISNSRHYSKTLIMNAQLTQEERDFLFSKLELREMIDLLQDNCTTAEEQQKIYKKVLEEESHVLEFIQLVELREEQKNPIIHVLSKSQYDCFSFLTSSLFDKVKKEFSNKQIQLIKNVVFKDSSDAYRYFTDHNELLENNDREVVLQKIFSSSHYLNKLLTQFRHLITSDEIDQILLRLSKNKTSLHQLLNDKSKTRYELNESQKIMIIDHVIKNQYIGSASIILKHLKVDEQTKDILNSMAVMEKMIK